MLQPRLTAQLREHVGADPRRRIRASRGQRRAGRDTAGAQRRQITRAQTGDARRVIDRFPPGLATLEKTTGLTGVARNRLGLARLIEEAGNPRLDTARV